jgi:hypothetical protein
MRSVSESLVPISELRFETAADYYTREVPLAAPYDTVYPRNLSVFLKLGFKPKYLAFFVLGIVYLADGCGGNSGAAIPCGMRIFIG